MYHETDTPDVFLDDVDNRHAAWGHDNLLAFRFVFKGNLRYLSILKAYGYKNRNAIKPCTEDITWFPQSLLPSEPDIKYCFYQRCLKSLPVPTG